MTTSVGRAAEEAEDREVEGTGMGEGLLISAWMPRLGIARCERCCMKRTMRKITHLPQHLVLQAEKKYLGDRRLHRYRYHPHRRGPPTRVRRSSRLNNML